MWGEVMGGATREPSSNNEMHELNFDDEDHGDVLLLITIKYLVYSWKVVGCYKCNGQDNWYTLF